MWRKLTYLVILVAVLGNLEIASGQLVTHWKLDETSGTTAYDSSGNGNDGTLNGNPQWTAGVIGGALHLDGSSDYVRIPFSESLRVLNRGDFTLTLWLNADQINKKHIVFQQMDLNGLGRSWLTIGNGNADNAIRTYVGGAWTVSGFVIEAGEWYHAAVVVTEGGGADSIQVYVNGEPEGNPRQDSMEDCEGDFIIGCAKTLSDTFTDGLVDDVRIYSQAMAEEDLQHIMQGIEGGFPLAIRPNPADGSQYEQTWANLSWRAGDFAVSHDLYFGTDFDDVNEGAEGTFVGNLAITQQVVGFPGFPAPQGLEPGTTYYWRVDEVNDADPNSPWKGAVWSFWVPPKSAYDPIPADGATFADANVDLRWSAGLKAVMENMYFGNDADEVAGAAGAPPAMGQTFDPGPLALGTTYFWRVDTFDGLQWTKGKVWSFTTLPEVAITDPSLIVWWTLDEGPGGMTAVDWSGHGHHGTFVSDPKWVDGYDGSALEFDGIDDSVVHRLSAEETWQAYTVTVWAKANTLWQPANNCVFANHMTYATDTPSMQISFDSSNNYQYHGSVDEIIGPVRTDWIHLAVSSDGPTTTVYYNGNLVSTVATGAGDPVFAKFAIGINRAEDRWFDGAIDDLRVYNRMLTQEEIELVMRVDPLLAWDASPASGSTPDIDAATPLSWSAGENASSHEVYFGRDKGAVDKADTSDASGIYRGRQTGTSFTPAEGVEWGGGPYYWRVDENNADGTITKGRVWDFTVADFLLIDDFESYTDNNAANEAIWQHWIDGFGVAANGSQVGNLVPPYAEQTIVHGGLQAMPLLYNNTAGVTNSEVELSLIAPRDWTRHGVGVLSLWFRGYPPSVGSFTEGPVGTFTMTAAGADIAGTSDEFHFAYKTLTGPGSITARVDSVLNTHDQAKTGVMIRATLDPNSPYAFACITPTDGVGSLGRTVAAGNSFNTFQAGISAPHWVKLERDVAGNFTVSHSANGSTWMPVGSAVPTAVSMGGTVYIGLALTSRNTAETGEAKFSNVTMTGNISGQWLHQDIGILGNNAEPLYIALSNANGAIAVVTNSDANAAVTDVWTEWQIDLSEFAVQGVNLAYVDKIAIGLGSRGNAAAAGGSGTVFLDDITLIRPGG